MNRIHINLLHFQTETYEKNKRVLVPWIGLKFNKETFQLIFPLYFDPDETLTDCLTDF